MDYNKERIDAYLNKTMEHLERIDFEKEIESDKNLAEMVELAYKKRCEQSADKADQPNLTDTNFNIRNHTKKNRKLSNLKYFVSRRKALDRQQKSYVLLSAITCIGLIILLFLIFQINFSSPQSSNNPNLYESDIKIPDDLTYYMDAHKYEKALLVIDSLEKEILLTYTKNAIENKANENNGEISEERVRTKKQLYELTWSKINVLLSLEEIYQASYILEEYKDKKGIHQQEAKELWKSLKETR